VFFGFDSSKQHCAGDNGMTAGNKEVMKEEKYFLDRRLRADQYAQRSIIT
jgi:hypothetical protein